MEESQQQQDFLHESGDNNVRGLQEKIKVMWKTIEELKKKVMEEKELLDKEKSENERMMEEQIKLRKQMVSNSSLPSPRRQRYTGCSYRHIYTQIVKDILKSPNPSSAGLPTLANSMFHLPHCPAYNTPCPVHSFKPQVHAISESQLQTFFFDQKDGFKGDLGIGDSSGRQSFEEMLQSLDSQPRVSLEKLAVEKKHSTAPHSGAQDRPSSFMLLLSEQWPSQVAAANTRAHESRHQNLKFDKVNNTGSSFELGEPQLSNPSQIYPDF